VVIIDLDRVKIRLARDEKKPGTKPGFQQDATV
jgi:hypothetical protein